MLQEGDILVFTGDTDTIAGLIEGKSGLQLPEVGMMKKRRKTEIVEIVISQNSSLIGKTVKTINFRSKYDAAIIAVHRNGVRVQEKLSEIMLRAGDVSCLFTGENFLVRTENTMDFYFISKVRGFVKLEWYKTAVLLGGLLLSILLSAFGVIRLFMGLIVVIIASLALKSPTPKIFRKVSIITWPLLSYFHWPWVLLWQNQEPPIYWPILISLFMPLGKIGILFGIFLITAILAAYITSKASAAIIFPDLSYHGGKPRSESRSLYPGSGFCFGRQLHDAHWFPDQPDGLWTGELFF